MIEKYRRYIEKSKKELLYRSLSNYPAEYLDFSSNDYLGLSTNTEVINAGYKTAMEYGAGSTGSRLLSGNRKIFGEFENLIAKDKHTESALIFNSGFQANTGLLECLCDRETTVIFDKLNHASMYQGIFASKAKLLRYNHLDYDHLEDILRKNYNNQKIIIASETVFGMDGDIANISILSDLSHRYGTVLYLDEAHATGLYGYNGYGISADYSLDNEKTIIIGTFSKALGCSGAYVACSENMRDYFIQRCKSFIYSTALSPFCIGAAMHSWQLIKTLGETRQRILKTTNNLQNRLNLTVNNTNITPLLFNDTKTMKQAKEKCLENRIIVSGITIPTSPTPRLRIAVNAKHQETDIEKLLKILTVI